MTKNKKFWNSDKIIGLLAIFISLGTLFVLIFQTNLMNEQKHQSVLPYMILFNRNSSSEAAIMIQNRGVGPAIIESNKILYDGATYEMDFQEFFIDKKILDTLNLNGYGSNTLKPGMLIMAGEEYRLFSVDSSKKDQNKLSQLMRKLREKGFEFEIIYTSIYDEKWKVTSRQRIPVKL